MKQSILKTTSLACFRNHLLKLRSLSTTYICWGYRVSKRPQKFLGYLPTWPQIAFDLSKYFCDVWPHFEIMFVTFDLINILVGFCDFWPHLDLIFVTFDLINKWRFHCHLPTSVWVTWFQKDLKFASQILHFHAIFQFDLRLPLTSVHIFVTSDFINKWRYLCCMDYKGVSWIQHPRGADPGYDLCQSGRGPGAA